MCQAVLSCVVSGWVGLGRLCLRCWLFLVSSSVAWEVVGLVSSSRTYPLLVGWLVSRLVSRLVTWLLGEK